MAVPPSTVGELTFEDFSNVQFVLSFVISEMLLSSLMLFGILLDVGLPIRSVLLTSRLVSLVSAMRPDFLGSV